MLFRSKNGHILINQDDIYTKEAKSTRALDYVASYMLLARIAADRYAQLPLSVELYKALQELVKQTLKARDFTLNKELSLHTYYVNNGSVNFLLLKDNKIVDQQQLVVADKITCLEISLQEGLIDKLNLLNVGQSFLYSTPPTITSAMNIEFTLNCVSAKKEIHPYRVILAMDLTIKTDAKVSVFQKDSFIAPVLIQELTP